MLWKLGVPVHLPNQGCRNNKSGAFTKFLSWLHSFSSKTVIIETPCDHTSQCALWKEITEIDSHTFLAKRSKISWNHHLSNLVEKLIWRKKCSIFCKNRGHDCENTVTNKAVILWCVHMHSMCTSTIMQS